MDNNNFLSQSFIYLLFILSRNIKFYVTSCTSLLISSITHSKGNFLNKYFCSDFPILIFLTFIGKLLTVRLKNILTVKCITEFGNASSE